ncbi:MAG: hypothetical protein JWO46_60 [Nocardioidaceae bacterium]|nr:hypothetical protein [Nocardioidaceae bacterium]
MNDERTTVMVAAGGAPWESAALDALSGPGLVVLRRCVDLPDLLAAATAGTAQVAVVADDLPGLDASAVLHLLRHDVRTVAVSGSASAGVLRRMGVVEVVPEQLLADGGDPAGLAEAVRAAVVRELVTDPDPEPDRVPTAPEGATPGRVLAVWGPAGAPGRTTVAVGLAAELASRGSRVVLADLDPYGGAVAQQLGVLDEVSGVLAAARRANAGELDASGFAACPRLAADGLELLTGLPRADRWVEVRDGVVDEMLGLGARGAHVVADTGFSLEDDESGLGRLGAGRNRMTLEAVSAADEVVVVGAADPVGLSRLARALVDLGDTCPGTRVRVVVNRMRDSLGWAEDDIRGMVEGFSRPTGIHFLPDDRVACDRALVAGRALTETGDSALRRAIAEVATALVPENLPAPARTRGLRRR